MALALSVAPYFRLKPNKAKEIAKEVQQAVAQWQIIATNYKIGKAEQARMARAFSK